MFIELVTFITQFGRMTAEFLKLQICFFPSMKLVKITAKSDDGISMQLKSEIVCKFNKYLTYFQFTDKPNT